MDSGNGVKNDFLMLHHAYVDEWLTVSYLPTIKTTFNGENNYYDIGTLNLKNINPRNYPFSEQLFTMDRNYLTIKSSFDKMLSDQLSLQTSSSPTTTADNDRTLRIETYQSSFQTFIERMKMMLEMRITELGGQIPSLEQLSLEDGSIDHNWMVMLNEASKRNTIMARSRLPTYTSTPSITSLQGPISVLWNEILYLVNKKEVSLSSRNQRHQQIVGTLSHLIFEWRVMIANSQKIINEDKRFKKNPFQNTNYDQSSSTFQISSPVLVSTSNPNFQALMNSSIPSNTYDPHGNNSNNNSPHSSVNSDHFESFMEHTNHSSSHSRSHSNDNSPTSTLTHPPIPPPTYSSSPSGNMMNHHNIPQTTPTSPGVSAWQRAIKRITTISTQPPIQSPQFSSGAPNTQQSQQSPSSQLNNSSNSISTHSGGNSSNNLDSNSNNTPIGGIIKQGWMKKRGGKNKSWKKRFFILDMKKTLRYYNYHKDKSQSSNSAKDKDSPMYNISNPILQNSSIIIKDSNGILSSNNPSISLTNSMNNNIISDNNLNNTNNGSNNNNSSSSSSSSSSTPSFNNNSNNNSNNLDSVTSYENLKYKGSIDLYTSLVVAIKPNTCNINLIENSNNNVLANSGVKDDSGSYFGMDIITPKRIWHLCCDSQKTMEEWLVILKSANK
ncbi:hypothetical protein DLAC_06959 [Tieghemostelium lacteum]|uniref:PH domain-containing protein n=1 Tax=Tieghemostelium lacteum TaxID=361077 RepID=A0A151ZDX2_TIELA|nr:hypothetical protein DLAC_06959 [Tieghemostelium lacteum]|eukprot:KYQ92119.1 hypothetical protein DLAC_06959 [Tieghemostelium lacteum]